MPKLRRMPARKLKLLICSAFSSYKCISALEKHVWIDDFLLDKDSSAVYWLQNIMIESTKDAHTWRTSWCDCLSIYLIFSSEFSQCGIAKDLILWQSFLAIINSAQSLQEVPHNLEVQVSLATEESLSKKVVLVNSLNRHQKLLLYNDRRFTEELWIRRARLFQSTNAFSRFCCSRSSSLHFSVIGSIACLFQM